MQLKSLSVVALALASVASAAVVVAGPAAATAGTPGTYTSVFPARILDTRSGNAVREARIGPRKTVTFDAIGRLSTSAVSAVAVTATVITPSSGGYLTVYRGGTSRPGTSTVNFRKGKTTANATVVRIGSGGRVSVYNGSTGSIGLAMDLSGYWSSGSVSSSTAGAFVPVTPTRLADTRRSGQHALAARTNRTMRAEGVGGLPGSHVSAIAINLTVVTPRSSGYLIAGAEATDPDHNRADLTFPANENRAQLVIVPVNPNGTITVFNGSPGTVQLVVDALGYFYDGAPSADGSFVPSSAYHAADATAMAPASTRQVALIPSDEAATGIFKAILITVLETVPTGSGYLTVWHGTGVRPHTSNVNFTPRQYHAATVVAPLNPDGTISIYNGSNGRVSVAVVVHGFVLNQVSDESDATAAKQVAAGMRSARRFAALHVAP